MTDYKETRTTAHESGIEERVTTFKVTQLIWMFLGLLEGLLALRFIFKLMGVNAANAVASLLYGVTDIFVAPFASLTGAPAAGGMVFEFSTILAMIIYGLVGWAFVRLVLIIFYRPRGPVNTRQTMVAEHTPQQGVSQTRTTTTDSTIENQVSDTENRYNG